MLVIIGSITVVLCVLGGYAAMGGKLYVLWQPFEFVIIAGAAAGAYIISNPKAVLGRTPKLIGTAMKGSRYNKDSYLELLSLLYQVFKIAKTRGLLALEQHIEKPEESTLFQQFPKFYGDHHAVVFMCDYLRLMSLGSDNPNELETLMEEEIETHHHEQMQVADAVQTMADGMPALGIVAAVLGVIKTMGAITEPPEVLGKLIGGALVGTFLGVWLSYGFIAPIASAMKAVINAEAKYLQCMKAGLLAHLHGYAPAVSVEYARKALLSEVRPTFYEVEEATAALPPA
ncbi:flagellar motor stator protein MotA [Arenibaculum pallidiluteum]|uniref:flagellar motor stator protein MotA n=1 Tax=Arenibaculum pallidiluteum TaxID=2812559 RepID=UPI001A973965|nr:flagellar motor stator protein MotA [Arenibaculum pallidiluteum]